MAGNVGLLKHASNVPQTALYLGELFTRAGFPQGSFQALLIGSARVERVIRDPRVAAVTLTGSGPAGASVGAVAGEMIKPSVLELGGSDAFVVMPSADLEKAAAVATTARCQNNGQSCIAAKRFIVHEAVADEFERRFVEHMSALTIGDPLEDIDRCRPPGHQFGARRRRRARRRCCGQGRQSALRRRAVDRPGLVLPPDGDQRADP